MIFTVITDERKIRNVKKRKGGRGIGNMEGDIVERR